jgi:uncharacterized protein
MQLSEMRFDSATPVDGYGPGFFRVGGQVWQGGVVIWAGGVTSWAGFDDQGPLLALADEIDVLFVGTGPEIAPLPTAFRQTLEAAGIGVELMSSPTAARTFNVVLSEGRRIGAALLPV